MSDLSTLYLQFEAVIDKKNRQFLLVPRQQQQKMLC